MEGVKGKKRDPYFTLLLLLTIMAVIGFGVLVAFGWPIFVETLEQFNHLQTF